MANQEKHVIVIAPQTILLAGGLILAAWLFVQLRQVVVIIFISWLIAATL